MISAQKKIWKKIILYSKLLFFLGKSWKYSLPLITKTVSQHTQTHFFANPHGTKTRIRIPPVLPEIICMATSGALKITDFQIFMLWYYNMLHRSLRCQNYVESLFWLMTRLPRKGFVKLRSGTPFFSSAKSKCLSIFSLLSTFLDNFLISLHVRVKVCDVSRLKSFCDFHGFVLAGSIRHPTKKNFW